MSESPAPSECELIDLAVRGDEDALTRLLHMHGAGVRARISPRIGVKWRNVLDADDVMQITYLEAFLNIHGFTNRGEGAFAAWLLRIATNNLRDAIEALSRLKRPSPDQRVVASGDESAVLLLDKLGCTTTTPSRSAGKREVAAAVKQAVSRLPDHYATVVRMYDLEGATAADVAARLGRSEGAVYMLRARAHDRLRAEFSGISFT
jgi:RNA polymerase sigma-70 factor (ECF subfamily)